MVERAVSGPRARVYLGNQFIGWATGVSVQEVRQLVRIDTLDDVYSKGIETVGIAVTMTVETVRILRKPLEAMGAWNEGTTRDIILSEPLTFDIYDVVGDAPIARVKGCTPESKNWRIGAREVTNVNVTYQAIKLEDNPPAN